jgi:hypothetical protein
MCIVFIFFACSRHRGPGTPVYTPTVNLTLTAIANTTQTAVALQTAGLTAQQTATAQAVLTQTAAASATMGGPTYTASFTATAIISPTAGTTVYAAGYYYDGSTSAPCYWAGNTLVPLSYTSVGGLATGIAVENGKVYVSGYLGNLGLGYTACYWEDSVRVDLPTNTFTAFAMAMDIKVSGTTIYVAGAVLDTTIFTPCYWTGSVRTDIPIPTATMSAVYFGNVIGGMGLSGGNVYISGGYAISSSEMVPCYWENLNRVKLPYIGISACASGIFADASGVYVSGRYGDISATQIPCYWANLVKTDLPFPSGTIADIVGICASAGTVYTSGYYFTLGFPETYGCYWENNIRHELDGAVTDVTRVSPAQKMTAYGGEVWIAGFYKGASYYIPCYWRGNVKHDLPGGAGDSAAFGICVK